MRLLYAAILLGMFIAGMLPLEAHATGNVLVPSTDSGSSSSANLGLVPANPSPPSPAPANAAPQAPQLPTMPSPPTTAPAQSMSLPYTPLPQPAPNTTIPAMQSAAPQPQIVKLPAMPIMPPTTTAAMPNNVSVNIDGKWGASTLKHVSDQLGIPADKVSSTCQISLTGILMTDKGGAPFNANMSTHAVVNYGGKIKSLMAVPMAFCNRAFPVPSNKGPIFQVGDKYFLSLGSGICQLSDGAAPPSKILLVSHDDGSLTCQYQ
jgi:hypothetical protein